MFEGSDSMILSGKILNLFFMNTKEFSEDVNIDKINLSGLNCNLLGTFKRIALFHQLPSPHLLLAIHNDTSDRGQKRAICDSVTSCNKDV